MELCSIASGSSGNCIYAGSDEARILVDAGLSGRRIESGLNEIGLSTPEVDGILLTHEHADHIKGLGVLSRKYGLPVYATQGTIDAVMQDPVVGEIDPALFRAVSPELPFMIGDMEITPVRKSHDAADPVAYVMRSGGRSMAVVTDLGIYDEHLAERLQGLDVLLIEANHDVSMLEAGKYPYPLKQRILSDRGHLSNELCGQLLGRVLHDRFRKAFLGHLSKENNYPPLAALSVRMEITLGDNPYKGSDFPIEIAGRDEISEFYEF